MAVEQQYTPLPWRVEWDAQNGQARIQGPRRDGKVNRHGFGDIVAVDLASDPDIPWMYPDQSPEDVANAHLLGKAAELAATMQAILRGDGPYADRNTGERLRLAHEALARALGEKEGE
jgi:hypothetical protein